MATKNITPRANEQGEIGTSAKKWLKGWFKQLLLGALGLVDSNEKALLKGEATTDAVNQFTIKNAAAGNPPEIQATGGDTNIPFKIVPKGNSPVTTPAGHEMTGEGKEFRAKKNTLSFTEQMLVSDAAIAWDLKNGNRARLTAEHNFTITITKPNGAIQAELIITQDGTGNRVMDEIITQKDEAIETSEVHPDTEIIDLSIDIPTGARIRFKTSAADLPDPLVVDTIYWAIRDSENHIKVATSKANALAGTAIDITDTGTGTHKVYQLVKWSDGTLGVLQTGPGGEDIVRLAYKPDDEQWYAELVANFS